MQHSGVIGTTNAATKIINQLVEIHYWKQFLDIGKGFQLSEALGAFEAQHNLPPPVR